MLVTNPTPDTQIVSDDVRRSVERAGNMSPVTQTPFEGRARKESQLTRPEMIDSYGPPTDAFRDLLDEVHANHQLQIDRHVVGDHYEARCSCGERFVWAGRYGQHLRHVMWVVAQSWRHNPFRYPTSIVNSL